MKFFQKLRSLWSGSSTHPLDLSYTRIQTYRRCPWMYHLVYSLGWRSGPNSSMAIGQSLHKALALYHSLPKAEKTLERLTSCLDEMWVNEGFKDTQETLDSYDRCRKYLESYFLTDQNRATTIVAVEKEYHVPLNDNIELYWTLDRLDKTPDGAYEIVEYKTNDHHWTEDRRQSELQMTLYALGMKKVIGDTELKLKYHFLSSNEVVTVQRTPDQIHAARIIIKNVADQLRKNRFEPNLESCPKCEFANRCTNASKTKFN